MLISLVLRKLFTHCACLQEEKFKYERVPDLLPDPDLNIPIPTRKTPIKTEVCFRVPSIHSHSQYQTVIIQKKILAHRTVTMKSRR